MKVAFIGDLHGDVGSARRILDQLPDDLDLILQVGDFGYWPNRNDFHAFMDAIADMNEKARLGFHWIDGNHEDHDAITTNFSEPSGYLSRSSITHFDDEVSVLALGGAISIDRYHRQEGRNWFRDEAPSLVELTEMHRAVGEFALLPTTKIIVSHEAPSSNPPFKGLPFELPQELLFGSMVHRVALEHFYRILDRLDLDFIWVHGHWHQHGVYLPYEGARIEVVGLDESRAPFDKCVLIFDTKEQEWV